MDGHSTGVPTGGEKGCSGRGAGLRFFWSCEPGARASDGVGVGRGQGTGDGGILFREERRPAAAVTGPWPEMGHFAAPKLLLIKANAHRVPRLRVKEAEGLGAARPRGGVCGKGPGSRTRATGSRAVPWGGRWASLRQPLPPPPTPCGGHPDRGGNGSQRRGVSGCGGSVGPGGAGAPAVWWAAAGGRPLPLPPLHLGTPALPLEGLTPDATPGCLLARSGLQGLY